MNQCAKKYLKYLNFKEKKNIFKIIIHDSKALKTKYPKSAHVYTYKSQYIKMAQSVL